MIKEEILLRGFKSSWFGTGGTTCLVVQSDIGNKYSPTIIVAAVTSQVNKSKLPTHLELNAQYKGLSKNSVVLLEQLRTIDKRRLRERVCVLIRYL